MKVKTSELVGPALDWAVGTACDLPVEVCQIFQYGRPNGKHYISIGETDRDGSEVDFNPCEEWSQGGPIIERERIGLKHRSYDSPPWWVAVIDVPDTSVTKRGCIGPTPLIAAMRCFCCAKLGDEIEIPQELESCQQPKT